MTNLALIKSPIEVQFEEQQLALDKRRLLWESSKHILGPVAAALHAAGIEPRLTDSLDISFSGDKDKIAQIFRIVRVAGFATTADRPKQGDSSWYAWFYHPDCKLAIWFSFSSSVCRRVKVGTELQEVDIYETQCGDIAIPLEVQLEE